MFSGCQPPKPGCEHILAQTAATCGHLEELRSLLTQSSWEVVSPFPTMLQVLLFFLRCVVPSPSDPDSHSESESDELELEELEESLELSEAMPVDSWRSTASARTASSGCSCFKILKGKRQCSQGCDSCWQHPLTVTWTQREGLHCLQHLEVAPGGTTGLGQTTQAVHTR